MSDKTSSSNVILKSNLIFSLRLVISDAQSNPDNSKTILQLLRRSSYLNRAFLNTNHCEAEINTTIFIIKYLNYLPELIENFTKYCIQNNSELIIYELVPILEDFLIDKKIKGIDAGLLGIIDRIYFSHRLIEELHDYLMCCLGYPVLEWNMSNSNLFVHELLGNYYGNLLDKTAIELSKQLIRDYPFSKHSNHKKSQFNHWPCFCEHSGLELNL